MERELRKLNSSWERQLPNQNHLMSHPHCFLFGLLPCGAVERMSTRTLATLLSVWHILHAKKVWTFEDSMPFWERKLLTRPFQRLQPHCFLLFPPPTKCLTHIAFYLFPDQQMPHPHCFLLFLPLLSFPPQNVRTPSRILTTLVRKYQEQIGSARRSGMQLAVFPRGTRFEIIYRVQYIKMNEDDSGASVNKAGSDKKKRSEAQGGARCCSNSSSVTL